MTELVARHTEGARVTMRGMFESVTWPLRKLAWRIEEWIWRVNDAIRRRPRKAAKADPYIPAETDLTDLPAPPAAAAPDAAAKAPRSFARLDAPVRDLAIALATVAVAVGAGIGVATLLGDDGAAQRPTRANGGASPSAHASIGAAASSPQTLQGVAPKFEDDSTAAQSGTQAETQVSPLEGTNSKPSSIPPGVAENIAAMKSARDFAGAFVLYEVGESDAEVRKAFARTATPALAKALQDRPPRLPDSVRVPTAKVQNVVLGAPAGSDDSRSIDASVSLLRLGDLSELRLTLTLRDGEWLVSEVRG